MLSLSRRVGERIVIGCGRGIVVEVRRIDRRTGKVMLGIAAPRKIPIFREELLEKEAVTCRSTES